MKNTSIKTFALAWLTLAAGSARATVIVQNTSGTETSPTADYQGESFTTPTDFLYYNLTFNFYSNVPATTPAAAGTAFLLSQPYAGTPAALSMTTPGFLTESTSATGGIFSFNPDFVLLTSTTYYLYTNEAFVASGGSASLPGTSYFSTSSTVPFAANGAGVLANFSLNGTRVGVPLPEPSSQTALYVLSGMMGLGFVVLRRRHARA